MIDRQNQNERESGTSPSPEILQISSQLNLHRIREIVEELRNAPTIFEGSKRLSELSNSIPDLQKENQLHFIWGNSEFLVYRGKTSEKAAQAIEFANQLKLDSAPQIFQSIDYVDGKILVLNYQGCASLAPIGVWSSECPTVSDSARQRFKNEMSILSDHGIVHDLAISGHEYWAVAPESGQIVLKGWHSCRTMRPGEKNEVSKRIQELLQDLS